MSNGRFGSVAACLALLLVMASPASAQGVIGFDGILSNRKENAFGMGLTLASRPLLAGTIGSTNWAVKLLGAADLEVVTGELSRDDICRPVDPTTGGFHYYRDCNTGAAIPPSIAEGSAPIRAYLAGFGVLDIWRIRLGLGISGHPGSGDTGASGLIGFAASPSSWFMVETPKFPNGGWRLRLQFALSGPPFVW